MWIVDDNTPIKDMEPYQVYPPGSYMTKILSCYVLWEPCHLLQQNSKLTQK